MKTLIVLTVAAIIILAASFAHATNSICLDDKPIDDPALKECRDIYSQKRFDNLKDKDHAIAVCAQAKNYYRR
jgi:hypothetical protein